MGETQEWTLPPSDLDWEHDFASRLTIVEQPFDPRTGIARSITQLVGKSMHGLHASALEAQT